MNINIEILKPEVMGILDQLVKLNLIKFNDSVEPKGFSELVNKLRNKVDSEVSNETIISIVEEVRQKRYNKD